MLAKAVCPSATCTIGGLRCAWAGTLGSGGSTIMVSNVMNWHLGGALSYHLLALFDEGLKFLLDLWVVRLHPMALDYPAQTGGESNICSSASVLHSNLHLETSAGGAQGRSCGPCVAALAPRHVMAAEQ